MPRLAEAVLGADGPACYALTFGRDSEGLATLRGRVWMRLRLRCERCLDDLVIPTDAEVALGLTLATTGADALGLTAVEGLPDDLDPLPLGREPIRPLDLVEDELLLAIPQVPMHPEGDCRMAESVAGPPAPAPVRENPFAALAALRSGAAESESSDH